MIRAQYPSQQTGALSRITEPFTPISPDSVRPFVYNAKVVKPQVVPILGAGEPTGIFSRIAAWFRGER